jgi:CRP/FNR family transcriptional regulator
MVKTAASPQFPCQTCEVRDKAICAALADDDLRLLSSIATTVKLNQGGTVFFEGDDSAYLFNVVTGAIRLSKLLPDGRRQITGFLFEGDFLGLAISDVYVYTAEALTQTSLCRFDRARLGELMERLPKLEHELLKLSSNELSEAQDHLMLLGQKKAVERLTTALLKLADRIGQYDDGGWKLELPMTRADLADYTGLTTETVSRTFTRLRNQGVIDTPDLRLVHIPDRSALAIRSGD